MPPYNYNYWRRRWPKRTTWRRRRRFTPWRPRQTFRRRRFRRRKYRVRRKRLIKRKLKKIILKEFQPKVIKKCTVKGLKCLYQCGKNRQSNNYAQYIYSVIPENWPTGGGWSMMVFSLASMYEDYQHLLNLWTTSNAGLNLVRYLGVEIKFYQDETIDYIVIPNTCYPMTAGPLSHPNSQPYRALMEKNKIIIPSVRTKPIRKRYKRKWFNPPSQMRNNWYFQQKICNIPLLMLTTVATDLRNTFLGTQQTSNNITLTCLNTTFFQNHNFQMPSATIGYTPANNRYLFADTQQAGKPTKKEQLIYLGNTKDDRPGVALRNTSMNKMENWGNPFNIHNLHPDQKLYVSTNPWTQLQNDNLAITEVSQPLFIKCRYTPDKDTGEGNEVYWVKNFAESNWDQPENFTLKITGLPLWCALWGWPDWVKKLRTIQRVDEDHIIVIKTTFMDNKLPAYVPLDDSFFNSKGAYGTEQTNYDKTHWYPKFQFQQESINSICESGPGVAKPAGNNSFEAKMLYKFKFKFGGCPSTLEKIYDPCSQEIYPIPSEKLQTIQITDPTTPKELTIHQWDTKRDILTEAATTRILQFTTTKDSSSFSTEYSKTCHLPTTSLQEELQKEIQEAQTQEEKTLPIEQQLKNIKQQQQQLRLRLLQYITQNIE
nr:MAG: ORF1 [TTV-like mini virus]